jgi:hypothetical protein
MCVCQTARSYGLAVAAASRSHGSSYLLHCRLKVKVKAKATLKMKASTVFLSGVGRARFRAFRLNATLFQ